MALLHQTIQQHLTSLNPEIDRAQRNTFPGQAHFGGTGPQGSVCRECNHWTGCGREAGYYAKRGMSGGGLKPRACGKFKALTHDIGPPIPFDAPACKYFELNPAPPPAFSK